jgi:hypothetical protein
MCKGLRLKKNYVIDLMKRDKNLVKGRIFINSFIRPDVFDAEQHTGLFLLHNLSADPKDMVQDGPTSKLIFGGNH